MLKEIRCSEFESYGEKRNPIVFHPGLNTVLGGQAAENSIGKSTFLLIIDYCFGGETYAKDSTKDQIGNHTIEFTFEFHGQEYYFSRDVLSPKMVKEFNSNGELIREMKLADFTQFLQDQYEMDMPPKSFRSTVGRFFRVAAKKNDTPSYPLSAARGEKLTAVYDAVEKLFELNRFVSELKEELKQITETQKAIAKAQKYKLITNAVKTDKQYQKNEEEIRRLQEEIDEFVKESDAAELGREISDASEAARIRGRISSLKREFRRLSARHKAILSNLEGNRQMQEADLSELSEYFPEIKMEKVENVQKFHRGIYEILETELREEAEGVYTLIQAADAEIKRLEKELTEQDETSKISPEFLRRYGEYKKRLEVLINQRDIYEQKKKVKDDAKFSEDQLEEEETNVLKQIEAKLNSELTRISDIIDDEVEPPAIHFDGRKDYTYGSPSDSGTGTSYKNLIILDLAFLNLTSLPAIAHDSSLFKNVADFPVDQILEYYMTRTKQIFIAFDKGIAYSERTQEILESTRVLQLDENGNELFGWSWKKKKKTKK